MCFVIVEIWNLIDRSRDKGTLNEMIVIVWMMFCLSNFYFYFYDFLLNVD